jgi:hypothetical protein
MLMSVIKIAKVRYFVLLDMFKKFNLDGGLHRSLA